MSKCKQCELSRRDMFRMGALGLGSSVFGLSVLSTLTAKNAYGLTPVSPFYDSVIQIFLFGGPSQTDTFDPKPGSANNKFATQLLGVNDKYGKPINIAVSLTKTVAAVQSGNCSLGVLRSMVHNNNDHDAAELITQSFWRTIGPAMLYPSVASVMSYYAQGRSPIGINAVSFDGACNDSKGNPISSALNATTSSMTPVLNRPVAATRYDRRKRMLGIVNADALAQRPDTLLRAADQAWQEAYSITTQGAASAAFDLTGKTLLPAADSGFQRRITLAQELVKAGVPYVSLGRGGNDSHTGNIAAINATWTNNVDTAISQLAMNLKPTGKRVLIVIGGEFGRTPYVGSDPMAQSTGDGRDHWADGFSWGLVSINQPKFKSGAWGDTGPDGIWRQSQNNLVDPVEMKDLGAFIYKAMGFQVGTAGTEVPLVDRTVFPVDPVNRSGDLMTYFGLV